MTRANIPAEHGHICMVQAPENIKVKGLNVRNTRLHLISQFISIIDRQRPLVNVYMLYAVNIVPAFSFPEDSKYVQFSEDDDPQLILTEIQVYMVKLHKSFHIL